MPLFVVPARSSPNANGARALRLPSLRWLAVPKSCLCWAVRFRSLVVLEPALAHDSTIGAFRVQPAGVPWTMVAQSLLHAELGKAGFSPLPSLANRPPEPIPLEALSSCCAVRGPALRQDGGEAPGAQSFALRCNS